MDDEKAKQRAKYYALEETAESRGSEAWQTDLEYRRMVEAWSLQIEKAYLAGYRTGFYDGQAEARTVRPIDEDS